MAGGWPAEENHKVCGIEFEQARRLRSGVAELEAQLDGVELRRGPRQQQVAIAHGMQGAGAAEGAADLVTADGFAHVVHHDQRGTRSIAQPQQTLAQSGHGAGVVFILIVGGVQRVQDDDLGSGGAGRRRGSDSALGAH